MWEDFVRDAVMKYSLFHAKGLRRNKLHFYSIDVSVKKEKNSPRPSVSQRASPPRYYLLYSFFLLRQQIKNVYQSATSNRVSVGNVYKSNGLNVCNSAHFGNRCGKWHFPLLANARVEVMLREFLCTSPRRCTSVCVSSYRTEIPHSPNRVRLNIVHPLLSQERHVNGKTAFRRREIFLTFQA